MLLGIVLSFLCLWGLWQWFGKSAREFGLSPLPWQVASSFCYVVGSQATYSTVRALVSADGGTASMLALGYGPYVGGVAIAAAVHAVLLVPAGRRRQASDAAAAQDRDAHDSEER